MPGVQQLRAFGLTIASDVPLPPLPGASGGGSLPDVRLTADDAGEVAAMSDLTPVWRSTFPDGSVVLAEVAPGGAQRLTFGERAAFRVSADGGSVACRFARADDPGALRFLLDTVLWWVSLTHGYEILHASAVALPGGVFAIASHSGGGKTTLAVELVRRGHLLFSDDVLAFERSADTLTAQAGPPLMNVPLAAGDVADIGTPLATFEDQGESWVALHRSCDEPAPLAGIVLLERGPGRKLGIERIDATVLDLLPHIWGLPHAAEGPKARFDAVSDIARIAPVFRLSAALDETPASLARNVEGVASQATGGCMIDV
jgi:hypothetical protein